ncbi:MAG: MFS transporter [Actinomycetota bacterium]
MEVEPPATDAAPPWREVFHGRRGRLAAGLLLLEAIAAIQYLAIATIMPDVRKDLGMVQLYGLAFTASSLAMLASIPIAGKAVDRFGPRRVLLQALALMGSGLMISGAAVAMPMLLAGQFVLGAGGGGLYAFSLGTVAKTFPERLQPRVLALLSSMWILPGLIGPPFAALIASTVGWRWAFIAPIPLLGLGWLLMAPAVGLVPAPENARTPLAPRWPLQLMVGAGLVFTSLAVVEWWAPILVVGGFVIAWPALRQIVVPGTLLAAPGIPAAGASAFLLSFGFIASDSFLTLMLTGVRGLSLGVASLALTAATLTWSAGSVWQSGRTARFSLSRLMQIGVAFIILGEIAVFATLWTAVPAAAAFAGWVFVGLGMGIAFPIPSLATMQQSGPGQEGRQLSSVLLMDMLGVASGAGLGGAAVAVANATHISLAVGIGASYVMGLFALAALMVTAPRLIARSRAQSALQA